MYVVSVYNVCVLCVVCGVFLCVVFVGMCEWCVCVCICVSWVWCVWCIEFVVIFRFLFYIVYRRLVLVICLGWKFGSIY